MTTERGHVPTKKGEEFIAAFKKFCKEQNIREHEIGKFLACIVDVDSEYISWGDAFKDLVERGYLTKVGVGE